MLKCDFSKVALQIYRRTPMPKCDFNKVAMPKCDFNKVAMPKCDFNKAARQLLKSHFGMGVLL